VLIEGADIVRLIKAQRIKWLKHTSTTNGPNKTNRKAIDWRPMGSSPVGRPRQQWQDDGIEDLKKS
jgi:hypothetical protein